MELLSAQERFLSSVMPEPNSGCFLWIGFIDYNGYGKFSWKWAHRLAYELFVGPIPRGLVIDHICSVRSCVNPDHLRAVTQKENIENTVARGRHFYARRTHCPNGHPYSGDNLCTHTRQRVCLACARVAGREHRLRKKAALANNQRST